MESSIELWAILQPSISSFAILIILNKFEKIVVLMVTMTRCTGSQIRPNVLLI